MRLGHLSSVELQLQPLPRVRSKRGQPVSVPDSRIMRHPKQRGAEHPPTQPGTYMHTCIGYEISHDEATLHGSLPRLNVNYRTVNQTAGG